MPGLPGAAGGGAREREPVGTGGEPGGHADRGGGGVPGHQPHDLHPHSAQERAPRLGLNSRGVVVTN